MRIQKTSTDKTRASSSFFVKILFEFLFGFFCCYSSNIAQAQPSGGPYGPIHKRYVEPKTSGKIFYVSPEGLSSVSGEKINEPTSIESAIKNANSGDVIILRGGIYRTGDLRINQGITIQPFEKEEPIFKGTKVAENWKDLGNGLWNIKWDKLFPVKPADWWQREREGKKTPLHRFNNDMVFVDGKLLQSAGWEGEVNENTFYIDYESGLIYIANNPENHVIEITAYDNAIVRTIGECHGKKSDKKGYKIYGVTFTQYAYRALEIEGVEPDGIMDESKTGKEVVGSVIENCEISYCSRVAGYFRGDNLTIRNCLIKETSTEGIYIIASNDVLLEKNIFTKNNNERITGYYPAAVKIFNQSNRVTCNDNLVIDHPYSNGIWYDVGNKDGVFTNNWIEGVGRLDGKFNYEKLWPSDNGFFFEISKGVVCAGNVFVNCDHGLMILNSSDAAIYNNTFINSSACIGRDGRKAEGDLFGWHSLTGPGVHEREGHKFVNNLLYGNADYDRPLLFVWQAPKLCSELKKSQLAEIDFNAYIIRKVRQRNPIIIWSPDVSNECRRDYIGAAEFITERRNQTGNSTSFEDYTAPLFKGELLKDYRVLPESGLSSKAKIIPDTIRIKIGCKENKFLGAYPKLW